MAADAWKTATANVKAALVTIAVVYFIGYVAYIVLLMNINVPDGYFATPSTWGQYHSCRFVSMAWWALFISSVRILLPLAVLVMIGVRKITGCISFHTVIIVLVTGLDILVAFFFIYLATTCNTGGTQCNICDDALKCCMQDAYSKGNCPNTGPCAFTLTKSQLHWNNTFKGLLWTNCIFLLADFLIVFCTSVIWFGFWGKPKIVEQEKPNVIAFQEAMNSTVPTTPVAPAAAFVHKRITGVPPLKLE